MGHIVWTQWDDLDAPAGVTMLGPSAAPIGSQAQRQATFYVPPYMSGFAGLELIREMRALQYVQLPNAGYDDAVDFRRAGLVFCNARGVHDISTAELALGLTIASLRELDRFILARSSGAWLSGGQSSLATKRVALVGYGSIGQTIGRLLEPFGSEVQAFTRTGGGDTRTMAEFDGLLPTFDVVVLILPATPETVNLMDKRRLGLMKDGALLVNVARGTIVDTDALVKELEFGRIRAALDVTNPEPLPADHPLWKAPGVIISPHVGGNSSAFEPAMRALLAEQFSRLVAGESLLNIVMRD
jgi:phosphoglycerate dehydrogenase-like enzyme